MTAVIVVRAHEVCTKNFPANINPVYPGVYQRLMGTYWFFAKWDGKKWRVSHVTSDRAARERVISMAKVPWRGMLIDPDNRRPGLVDIVVRLQAQTPRASAERIRALAKEEWHKRFGPAWERKQEK